MIKVGSFTSGGTTISGISSTKTLWVGSFVYAAGLDVSTKVVSIDDANTVTIDKDALADGTNISIDFTNSNVGVWQEKFCAMKDAQDVVAERGEHLQFLLLTESTAIRDRYGTIVGGGPIIINMNGFPVRPDPRDRERTSGGEREESQIEILTATNDWLALGYTFEDLNPEKMTCRFRGEKYEQITAQQRSHFGDDFLNIAFRLFKK